MAETGSLRSFRIAGRLATGFTLDLVKLGGHRRDVIDALLRAAVMHANVAHIIRDAELQQRFAGLDDDVPEEMRRPASVHAIAESLRIPYETARRRLGRMAEQGVCLVTTNGVIVRHAMTSSPFYREACQAQYDKLREVYGRLCAVGAVASPAAGAAPFEGPAPVRLVGRLVVEYVLRFTDPISLLVGDILSGVVLMDIVQANTEQLPDTEAGTEAVDAAGYVPDERRRPVSAAALAARLGAPTETIRRHVLDLVARDFCRRQVGGYVIPAEVLARPAFVQIVTANHANLVRLFAALAEFGVPAAWDRARQESAA